MIRVENLWKSYGGAFALRGIDFEVPTGTVTGFLGPNGAGKSTTMRILTTFSPPTRGRALVAGFDVSRHPREVCRRVGYLPEEMPIYPELRVVEYLRYRGRLRGLPRDVRNSAVDRVLIDCGLRDHVRATLGSLSKGYRQRLGLADALLHDPEVLILDEPTSGLDPRQVIAVRRLIESFRGNRTVLFSSHILGEIERTCDRIVILADGEIRLHDGTSALERRLEGESRIRLVFSELTGEIERSLDDQPGVLSVEPRGQELLIRTDRDIRGELLETAQRNSWGLLELSTERMTLEDMFLRATACAGSQDPMGRRHG